MTTLTTNQRLRLEQAYKNLESKHYSSATMLLKGLVEEGIEDQAILTAMAHATIGCGSFDYAIEATRRLLLLEPDSAEALILRANAFRFLNKMDDAHAMCDEAIKRNPSEPAAIAMKSTLYRLQGDYVRAYEMLKEPFAKGELTSDMITNFAQIAPHFKLTDYAIDVLSRFKDHPDLNPEQRNDVLFHLADLLDKARREDEAWAVYCEANSALRRPYDAQAHSDRVTRIIEKTWSADAMAELPDSGIDSPLPIYILGMPRSGTSLVEQILDSHPLIFGAGELSEISRIHAELETKLSRAAEPEQKREIFGRSVRTAAESLLDRMQQKSPSSQYITDKMPGNFLHIGLISKLFPKSRIIFCRKNAFDNCLGVFFKSFKGSHPYSYDISDVANYYHDHVRLQEHWMTMSPVPIMELRHDDLVADQEGQTRRLLEFVGVPWDESCLNFHQNKRVTITASNAQVRQPIYKTKTPRWKRYEKYIGPIRDVLGDPEE